MFIIIAVFLAGILLYAGAVRGDAPEASHQWEIVVGAVVLYVLFGGFFPGCSSLNVIGCSDVF